MIRTLFTLVEEFTLLVLPHGGQRRARRNAWRAAADLYVEPSTAELRAIARLLPQPPRRMAVGAE